MTARQAALDIEAPDQLRHYLRARGLIADDEEPATKVLAGGVSNRAVWVRRGDGEEWVVKQALAKLRVQVDWFSAPERIQREAAGLRWLGRIITGRVPEIVTEDRQHDILVMTAVPQPHDNWKVLLLNGCIDLGFAREFGILLARIHGAVEHYPELADEFAERRFFEELRLEPYYRYSASQVPQAAGFMTRLIEETRARRFALVHGDYSPKNALIQRDRLVILDFEVIHFGDPAFDIGFSLTHFLSKAHHMPARREGFLEMARAYWRSYARTLSPQMRERARQTAARHTLACLIARAAGRSPLEYLDDSKRDRQTRIALNLMRRDISEILDLIDAFGAELGRIRE